LEIGAQRGLAGKEVNVALSDRELRKLRGMSDADLTAQSGDDAYLVEANLRLKRSTEILTTVLIGITVVLGALTLPLTVEVVRNLFH
jgi:hypothetical protein